MNVAQVCREACTTRKTFLQVGGSHRRGAGRFGGTIALPVVVAVEDTGGDEDLIVGLRAEMTAG